MLLGEVAPVIPGCAGCAMAHPDFGRSVNPISTRGDRLRPPNYYWHTRIFRSCDGPEQGYLIVIFLVQISFKGSAKSSNHHQRI